MTTLSAEARFELKDAQAMIDDVCEHLREHAVEIYEQNGRKVLTFWEWGKCSIVMNGDDVVLNAEASSLTGIAVVKDTVSQEVIEHSPHLADKIVWSGDGSNLIHPAWFCILNVANTWRLTPHVQRIRFRGSNLGRYSGFGNIHMKLMFPRPDNPIPQWPHVSPNGLTVYPPRDELAIREYTYRHIDVAAGTLEVDFVLHEGTGPGSAFAAQAKPGDIIGMSGPGGYSAPLDRDWYILAGDETAIPAISRILGTLPATARGVALIEVADAAEEQPIDTQAGMEIRWLHRNGAAPGTTNLLPKAVRSVEFPSDGSSVFAWAGCEFTAFKDIRQYFRKGRKLKKGESLIVSYWRQEKKFGEHVDHVRDH